MNANLSEARLLPHVPCRGIIVVFFIVLAVQGLGQALAQDGFIPMNPPAAFKPSDIFFDPPPARNPGQLVDLNNKPGDCIIARDIEVRGWLVTAYVNDQALHNPNGHCDIRIEDSHYPLLPDFDWILDPNNNPTLSQLPGASLPGHGIHRDYLICPANDPFSSHPCAPCDHAETTQTLPFQDLVPNSFDPNNAFFPADAPCFDRDGLPWTCLFAGITPNSFILPGNFEVCVMPIIVVELNAYWSDVRSDLPASLLNQQANPHAFQDPTDPRIFWPFNPINPDGMTNPDGSSRGLQPGDYVRIRGTLWQDTHGTGDPHFDSCFDNGPLRGHGDSHIEIHPVDLIERNPSRSLDPAAFSEICGGNMATHPTDATPRVRYELLQMCIGVDALDVSKTNDLKIIPTIPQPSPLCRLKVKEWVDGRLTDLRNVDRRSVVAVEDPSDPHVDVHLEMHSSGILSLEPREARFKAMYEVWWDCPPTITCPPNITVNTAPDRCSAAVPFLVSASDERPGVVVGSSPPSGSEFSVGTTTVNCTATDNTGNTTACSFTVTVRDTQPPNLTCPANIIQCNDPGKCGAVVSYPAVVATDNCSGVSVTLDPVSGTFFPKGVTSVLCTATDSSGNKATCMFNVTVNDCEAPVVGCRSGLDSSSKKHDKKEHNSFVQVLANDNCDPAPRCYIADSASGFVAGPFASGDLVKITHARGAVPRQMHSGENVAAHIVIRGDALLYAVDASGNVSQKTNCE